jgi:HEAT repeat protein
MGVSVETLLLCLVCIYALSFCLVTVWARFLTFSLRRRNLEKAAFWNGLESRWQPLVAAFMAGQASAGVVQAQIQAGEELYFVDYLMRHTLARDPQARDRCLPLVRPYLKALAQRVETGDREQRARAILTLTLLGDHQFLPVFLKALADRSPLAALLAARALATWGEAVVAEHLLPVLRRFESWDPKVLAHVLALPGKTVAPILRACVRDRQASVWEQTIALRALTELRDPLATPLALEILRSGQDVNLSVAALQLLAQMGGSEHLPLLRACCQSSSFPIRLHAIRALASVGAAKEQDLFREALDDPSPWVALQAAHSLKQTGAHQVLQALDLNAHPRAVLAEQVLGEFNSLACVADSVKDPAFATHIPRLFQQLKRHDSHEIKQLVTRLFFDPETAAEVRYAMAAELEPFKDYQFFYQTLNGLMMGNFSDPRALIRALKSFAHLESVPILIRLYDHVETLLKLEIIDTLGALDSVDSLEFLIRLHHALQLLPATDDHQTVVLQEKLARVMAQRVMG